MGKVLFFLTFSIFTVAFLILIIGFGFRNTKKPFVSLSETEVLKQLEEKYEKSFQIVKSEDLTALMADNELRIETWGSAVTGGTVYTVSPLNDPKFTFNAYSYEITYNSNPIPPIGGPDYKQNFRDTYEECLLDKQFADMAEKYELIYSKNSIGFSISAQKEAQIEPSVIKELKETYPFYFDYEISVTDQNKEEIAHKLAGCLQELISEYSYSINSGGGNIITLNGDDGSEYLKLFYDKEETPFVSSEEELLDLIKNITMNEEKRLDELVKYNAQLTDFIENPDKYTDFFESINAVSSVDKREDETYLVVKLANGDEARFQKTLDSFIMNRPFVTPQETLETAQISISAPVDFEGESTAGISVHHLKEEGDVPKHQYSLRLFAPDFQEFKLVGQDNELEYIEKFKKLVTPKEVSDSYWQVCELEQQMLQEFANQRVKEETPN